MLETAGLDRGIADQADEVPYLEANQHGMCLVNQTDDNGTLLHCLLCIFNLEYPALRGASLEQ